MAGLRRLNWIVRAFSTYTSDSFRVGFILGFEKKLTACNCFISLRYGSVEVLKWIALVSCVVQISR